VTGSAFEPELPLLPYAGTSGWSGSDTSEERARTADTDGTTPRRQGQALASLRLAGGRGLTWKELADARGWHHGTASGVLSVLHKEGRIVRLRDERRQRSAVYVLRGLQGERPVAPHGRGKKDAAPSFVLSKGEEQALARVRLNLNDPRAFIAVSDVRQITAALERALRS
jgi:DNA-binding MarR family transcriptional regulator